MTNRRHILYIALIALLMHSAAIMVIAQPELPEKPEILRVTVDSTDGRTYVEWEASASPGIIGYKVYTLDITTYPVTGFLLDSLPGDRFAFNYLNKAHGAPYYTVTAVSEEGESLLSGNYHKPVSLEISYDSCSNKMELEWEEYVGWETKLNGYRIYAKNYLPDTCDCDDAGGPADDNGFVEIAVNRADELSFAHEPVDENRYYEYVVEAFDNQGSRSTSNRVQYFTYMPAPPGFISLDYVTVLDESTIELSISADITGEINDFLVSRSTSPQGTYTPVQTLLDLNEANIHITDDVVTQGQMFYYKAEALNSCFHPVKSSNTGNNILVRGTADESVVRLDWQPYEYFPSSVESYAVYRKNRYGEQELIATVTPDTRSYSENIRNSGDRNIEGAVEYVVEAWESGTNPLGISGISRSNAVVVNIETRMYLPNAFTPNNDGRNDYFAPVIDFIPEEYNMFIYDRTGKVLYRTTDPLAGWDGSINGSGKAREGVYVYHIEYLSYNGTRQIATGNLTLIYP